MAPFELPACLPACLPSSMLPGMCWKLQVPDMQPGLMYAASLRADAPKLSCVLQPPPNCMLKERGQGARRGVGCYLEVWSVDVTGQSIQHHLFPGSGCTA